MAAPESDFVFNVVWTGEVFSHLRYFVQSLMAESAARFRFVVNCCTPESTAAIEGFAGRHGDRVIDVLDVSPDRMVGHGLALDRVLEQRDDGEYFCFVDADIKASGPFLNEFAELLVDHDAVSSGREVWTDENVVPEDHLGVGIGGRHFYHPDGFVYGCPHFAMYRREILDETMSRWDVGLGARGSELPEATGERLTELGHRYMAYDTAKVVNILLQGDGHRLTHVEHPALVHIGGMSHYLSPPEWDTREGRDGEPSWTLMNGMEPRTRVARFTAGMLRELEAGRPAPEIPDGLDPDLAAKLVFVRDEMTDLVARYASEAGGSA